MQHLLILNLLPLALSLSLISSPESDTPVVHSPIPAAMVCNCSITQDGNTYPISALMGNESAVSFYDYGNPSGSSANTGLEIQSALILFLYEDIGTGVISLFLIADIVNNGEGGSLSFEFNCAPDGSFISVQDDAGEFFGAPPLFTGNWSWTPCCTDGGVIENIGCNNSLSLDLLIASGIDSIVWLTGDIADPDQILLSLTGESITINCGGGVCCPIGFDTEVSIVDATCDDTPNGSITVSPQDGIAPYTYQWSNGATMPSNNGLLPNTYGVTITDSQGCTEELAMTIDFSPGSPAAQPASLDVCSTNPEDEFDLTTVEDIVNAGSGFEVLWYENADLSGDILFPSTYVSGGTTVYAVVDNGSCLSVPVPVVLTLYPVPPAYEATIELCDEGNEMAEFDLTSVDDIVSDGGGDVSWYLSANLTGPISDPESFNSGSQFVYAVVDDGHCMSEAVDVQLIVHSLPEGFPTDAHLCSDGFDQAAFDLTLLEPDVSGGNGTVEWYLDADLLDLVPIPSFFQTTTTTVYAVISDGFCFSIPIPVDLIVDPVPVGNPLTLQSCDDGAGIGIFALQDYDDQVNGGFGDVDWFLDIALSDPVQNPAAFMTATTIVYAVIDNGTCVSGPVAVNLNVVQSPVGIPASIETCAEVSGQGIFNLTAIENIVNGGVGTVSWYADNGGLMPILLPGGYMSGNATVYAQVNSNGCLSAFVPVQLILINSVSATPAQLSVCDDGTGMPIFNLTTIEDAISGGAGQVNWFSDATGMNVLVSPGMFISGNNTVYANVSAGSCISGLVPIALIVLPLPQAMSTSMNLCGDVNGELTFDLTTLDATISSGMGNVLWFSDVLMTNSISNPSSFSTGDTILYAAVTNGLCVSSAQPIQLFVTPQLTANQVTQEYCIPDGDMIMIDLTQFDDDIGGGSLNVGWFLDPAGANQIPVPSSFQVANTQTLFINTTDGICSSPIIPFNISVHAVPVANSLNIERCGDPAGQVTIDLTAIDTLVSEQTGTVSWFLDAVLTNQILNVQNFTTGETILYVTVTNGFCTSPVVPIPVSIVDNLTAYPVNVEVCAIDNDTSLIDLTIYDVEFSGGNGSVFWFNDSTGLDTIKNPATYVTHGDTLYAMVTADGCFSALVAIPVEIESATTPTPLCIFSSLDSVSFAWAGDADEYEISYTIDGQVTTGPFITQAKEFGLGELGHGVVVNLVVTALYNSICTASLSNSISCTTDDCPNATIIIQKPFIICSDDDPFNLDVEIFGIAGMMDVSWSGDGIIDASGIFDPSQSVDGDNKVKVTVTQGSCIYIDSVNLGVVMTPIASFTLTGSTCVDSTLELLFNGYGFLSSGWDWDFAGAEVMPHNRPVDFYLSWDAPGEYLLSLIIDFHGCISNLFEFPVVIDATIAPLELVCEEEDYYSLIVGWEPVEGASSYVATTSMGSGKIVGNTYAVTQLPDNTEVEITVEAISPSACGKSISTIQCQTLDYISPEIYLPDIFSPDDDGINDVFFIQSNSRITEVTLLRIYDRWGETVFEDQLFPANDPSHGWTGRFSGKLLNPGVYVYLAEMQTDDGNKIVKTGNITLMH